MTNKNHRAGFVTLIGKPNVGKSTFINTAVGAKVSIVTNKPQTTRNQIRGIYNDENTQIVFLDNPGIHKSKRLLTKEMNRVSLKSTKGVDLIVYLIDSKHGITKEDEFIIKQLKEIQDTPIIIGLTKVDLIQKEKLISLIGQLTTEIPQYKDIVPINCKKEKDVNIILKEVKKIIPEHPPFYDKDEMTDKGNKFQIAEIIREKALNSLYQEVPHSIFVEVTSLTDDIKKNVIVVDADIVVERASQKKVVIGKQGAMLKRIGTAARFELEQDYEAKFFLNLYVKVQDKWRDDGKFISEFEVV